MEKRNEQITTKERSLRENDIYWKWQKKMHKKMDTEVIHLERELITSYYLSCMNIRITLLNLNKSPSSSMIFTGRGSMGTSDPGQHNWGVLLPSKPCCSEGCSHPFLPTGGILRTGEATLLAGNQKTLLKAI